MTRGADPRNLNGALEFGRMISTPLLAVIEAQAQAAQATMDFVHQVGMENDKLKMVPFRIPGGSKDGPAAETQVLVPKLSLLSVPNLRIEEAAVDFWAKVIGPAPPRADDLTAAQPAPLRLQLSFAHQRRTLGQPVSGTAYTMRINLKIVQDELLPGIEQLLHQAAQ